MKRKQVHYIIYKNRIHKLGECLGTLGASV